MVVGVRARTRVGVTRRDEKDLTLTLTLTLTRVGVTRRDEKERSLHRLT